MTKLPSGMDTIITPTSEESGSVKTDAVPFCMARWPPFSSTVAKSKEIARKLGFDAFDAHRRIEGATTAEPTAIAPEPPPLQLRCDGSAIAVAGCGPLLQTVRLPRSVAERRARARRIPIVRRDPGRRHAIGCV